MPTLGVMTDPGFPHKLAISIAGDLATALPTTPAEQGEGSEQRDSTGQWEIRISRQTLPITPDGVIPLFATAESIRDREGWDYVVYVTDLPLTHDGHSMLAEASPVARAALVSLPPLGIFRPQSRLQRLLSVLVSSMVEGPPEPDGLLSLGWQVRHRLSDSSDHWYVLSHGLGNKLRLVLGMVRSNRPVRLLHALSNSAGTAVAAGAFGIFYTSIWTLADALPEWRLAVISVLAIGVLSGWLIIRNGLWISPRDAFDVGPGRRDNAATTITIMLSAVIMYLLLFVVLFCAALIVIASSYLREQVGHPIDVVDYVKLSWMAASLGTMAGALGSNFDDETAIREATYHRREHQRRRLDQAQDHT